MKEDSKKREVMENYTFRIPADLRQRLQTLADEEGRSLSNYIVFLLKKAVGKK